MPPRIKENKQKPSVPLSKERRIGDEKENICSDKFPKGKKNYRNSIKLQSEEIKADELVKLSLSPEEQKLKPKAVGFWSKKLQDLELKKGVDIAEEHSLYEFNGTDESRAYQKMKKSKKKAGASKRKKVAVAKFNRPASLHQKIIKKPDKKIKSEKKIKEAHRHSLFREQIILSKEREQLADRGKKFTFSPGMSSLGITSTPALNKDNLIGASIFLFLSPITKEGAECCRTISECTPLKSRAAEDPIVNPGLKTPTAETELKRISCRRVLRSGKVLNI